MNTIIFKTFEELCNYVVDKNPNANINQSIYQTIVDNLVDNENTYEINCVETIKAFLLENNSNNYRCTICDKFVIECVNIRFVVNFNEINMILSDKILMFHIYVSDNFVDEYCIFIKISNNIRKIHLCDHYNINVEDHENVISWPCGPEHFIAARYLHNTFHKFDNHFRINHENFREIDLFEFYKNSWFNPDDNETQTAVWFKTMDKCLKIFLPHNWSIKSARND